jgi:hypothetical protein
VFETQTPIVVSFVVAVVVVAEEGVLVHLGGVEERCVVGTLHFGGTLTFYVE